MLEHQIDNQTYEKYLLNQTSFDNALPQAAAAQAKLAVKDHYTFDFLELVAAGANMQRFGRSGNADGFWASNLGFAANPGMNSGVPQTST